MVGLPRQLHIAVLRSLQAERLGGSLGLIVAVMYEAAAVPTPSGGWAVVGAEVGLYQCRSRLRSLDGCGTQVCRQSTFPARALLAKQAAQTASDPSAHIVRAELYDSEVRVCNTTEAVCEKLQSAAAHLVAVMHDSKDAAPKRCQNNPGFMCCVCCGERQAIRNLCEGQH